MRTAALLCTVLALGTACADTPERDAALPAAAAEHASPAVAGTRVVFAWVGELTLVDVEAGTSETFDVPELAAGDPPHFLVRRGDHLVFWGYATYALDVRNLKDDPVVIAEDSWFFVPSANPDRVWVVVRDKTQGSASHYFFSEVREVTAEGEVTAVGPAMGDAWLDGAVDAGVVFESEDDLVVWDPVDQEVIRAFGNPPMAAAHGNLVVWCRSRCPELRVTNVLTGADRTIEPPPGSDRFDGWGGEFTPDGGLFAVPVGNPPRYEGSGAAAIVDMETGDVDVVPGSEEASGIPSVTWDPSGSRLFLAVGQHGRFELRYYDLGTERARTASVSPPRDFFDMAAA